MLINCNNQGCLKSSNALYDESTQEVICQECNRPIKNISEFMIRTLKSSGQILRDKPKAFTMMCGKCKKNQEVVLDQYNNTLCKICHSKVPMSMPFRLAMEETGIKLERIVVESPTESQAENKPTKNIRKKNKGKK